MVIINLEELKKVQFVFLCSRFYGSIHKILRSHNAVNCRLIEKCLTNFPVAILKFIGKLYKKKHFNINLHKLIFRNIEYRMFQKH